MEIITVHNSDITEPCPRIETLDAMGFYRPSVRQIETLFSRETGNLLESLSDIVTWGDAVATLASATIFRLVFLGHLSAPFGVGGADNPDVARALADLAVTGENNYQSFVSAGRVADTGTLSTEQIRESVKMALGSAAERAGLPFSLALDGDEVTEGLSFVMDRAIGVVWALDGPHSHRTLARPMLEWIAVNSERDQARRPTNVGASTWPTADCQVTLTFHGITSTIRTRYAIGGATDSLIDVSEFTIPDAQRVPVIPDDALVFIFLHGHSSRLEEGGQLYDELARASRESTMRRPIVMVSFDFPSNGYSAYFDHDVIAPMDATTRYVPDHPEERRFGILELYEKFVESFVESLDRDIVASGQRSILTRIGAVVGGSMGGNLGLRLSERLVTTSPWLESIVSWSPACAYESFGNKDYATPSPGEEFDPIGKQALDRAYDRSRQGEGGGSRGDFLRLQITGERLINDGTGEFEFMTRFLGFLIAPAIQFIPLVGPLIQPFLSGALAPTIAGAFGVEYAANIIAVNQSDEWLRDACRVGYDSATATQARVIELSEIYSSIRRRTHWRVAYEQLLFSHRDRIALTGRITCYERSIIRTLLIAGSKDITDSLTGFDIYNGVRYMAPRMTANPGRAIYIEETGHSIHAERPKWLAREIIRFIQEGLSHEVVAVSRTESGSIEKLYFTPSIPFIERNTAIDTIIDRRISPFYFRLSDGTKQYIYARRFLRTAGDTTEANNLRSLPETRLAPITGWEATRHYGPNEGFEVTHIRLRSTGPEPWNTWISHLCNDSTGFEIPTRLAEYRVYHGDARYFLTYAGSEYTLEIGQYLYTNPDETEENNLSSLEDIESYLDRVA